MTWVKLEKDLKSTVDSAVWLTYEQPDSESGNSDCFPRILRQIYRIPARHSSHLLSWSVACLQFGQVLAFFYQFRWPSHSTNFTFADKIWIETILSLSLVTGRFPPTLVTSISWEDCYSRWLEGLTALKVLYLGLILSWEAASEKRIFW